MEAIVNLFAGARDTYVHVFIYLHGIAGYYLSVKSLGKSQSKSAFPPTRRTYHGKHRLFICHTSFSVSLLNQHRVSEGEKSVFLLNGSFVGLHDLLPIIECRYQHQKSAFG